MAARHRGTAGGVATEHAVDLATVELRLTGKIEAARKEIAGVRAEISSFRKDVDQRFEDVDQRFEDVMTALREIKERLP